MFQLRQSFLLFLTATIWGSGFVAQSIGMDHVTPFTYTFFRTLLGALFLVPIILFMRARAAKNAAYQDQAAPQNQATSDPSEASAAPTALMQTPKSRRDLFWGSCWCGLFLVGGESFQQFGLVSTDAGKAGFITSMYIIFVPLVGLILGKKINVNIVIGVFLSLVGLYLLCIKGSFTLEQGDLLIFICAIVFSFHILCIDHFVHKCDGVALSCGQFFAASILALVLMLIFDHDVFAWADVYAALGALLWSGIMSNGIAYTLQVVGQRGMNPTIATLILSLESVMAVIFGVLLLNENLSFREGLGCFLILTAVIVAQVSPRALLALLNQSRNQARPAPTTNASVATAATPAATIAAAAATAPETAPLSAKQHHD